MLSSFTSTRSDSVAKGLQALPVSNQTTTAKTSHASSLVAGPNQPTTSSTVGYQPASRASRKTRTATPRVVEPYYYKAPNSNPYSNATDQQLASQLRNYENTRQPAISNTSVDVNQPRGEAILSKLAEDTPPASVQLSDQLTASRLDEPMDAGNVFHTAPTGRSRPQSTRAVLSGGNSYGSKKTVAWLIPVVVHEDQAIRDGQQVKLRLLKEITADGITIPINTILYALCQLSNDRLQLTVRNLQLGGQLIPLDLEVYDTDGSMGVNVPGLSQSSQVNGQLRSSAVQGVQLPGIGGLANTVLSSARMGASQSMRQTTIRLRAGYNLYLKAQ